LNQNLGWKQGRIAAPGREPGSLFTDVLAFIITGLPLSSRASPGFQPTESGSGVLADRYLSVYLNVNVPL
jgi:hypothetical protein